MLESALHRPPAGWWSRALLTLELGPSAPPPLPVPYTGGPGPSTKPPLPPLPTLACGLPPLRAAHSPALCHSASLFPGLVCSTLRYLPPHPQLTEGPSTTSVSAQLRTTSSRLLFLWLGFTFNFPSLLPGSECPLPHPAPNLSLGPVSHTG